MNSYSNKNLINYSNINYVYYKGSIDNFIIENMSPSYLKNISIDNFYKNIKKNGNSIYMKYLNLPNLINQYDIDKNRLLGLKTTYKYTNINNYIEDNNIKTKILFFSNQGIFYNIWKFISYFIISYENNLEKLKLPTKININKLLEEAKKNYKIKSSEVETQKIFASKFGSLKSIFLTKNTIKKNNNNNLIQHINYNLKILYEKTFVGIIHVDIFNDFFKNETSINCNFMNIFNNIYYAKQNIKNFLIPKIIPITKTNNRINIMENPIDRTKDMMLISFNEANKKYSVSDVLPIIYKVMREMPNFIVISTQESKSGGLTNVIGARHFQHILKQCLLNLNYGMLVKNDASKIGIFDKNVRTRIYYNKYYVNYEENKTFGAYKTLKKQGYMSHYLSDNSDRRKIAQNISQEQIFNNNTQKYGKNIVKNNKNKFNIISFGTSLSKISGLGNLSKKTIFKGSIFTRLVFKDNDTNKIYKFAFVNSHLYYNKKGNTGLAQRTTEFLNLIDEFKLVDWWNIGYNIFFSGDLNFRLLSFNTTKNDPFSNKFNKESYDIVKKYSTNKSLHKTNTFEQLKFNDELYKILLKQAGQDNSFKALNNNNTNFGIKGINIQRMPTNKTLNTIIAEQKQAFFKKFLESYDTLKINLTSKYFENQGNKNSNFYKKFYNSSGIPTNNEIKGIFEIRPQKNLKGGGLTLSKPKQQKEIKIYPRIPSNTDRILYALSDNLNINADYYDINIFPNKSDHKMLILSFDLEDFNEKLYLLDFSVQNNNIILSYNNQTNNNNNNNISKTNEMSNIKNRTKNISGII